ncbi:MAG TPA: DNA topoisomerase I, partial [Methanocorpusculum sp.]|nr:DNA topoisomerase I [Methanocorpusculum sp.]
MLSDKQKIAVKRNGNVEYYMVNDYIVMGLRGHVVGLDFVKDYKNWRSEDHPPRSLINAEIIKYPTEKKIVTILQKHAKKADKVTIATDYDTEGELIGMEAYELILEVNKSVSIDRARFSSITKSEILDSIKNATKLNFNLAYAGATRQIIDLVWGASITRFLSIVARRGPNNILSVGRVQSPTLAMIVDREKEIESFVPEKYWVLGLNVKINGTEHLAKHTTNKFTCKSDADNAYNNTGDPVIVKEVITGKKVDYAPTPLDTTALIVGANRLGLSAVSVMNKAEYLYMHGYISYPRTDNTYYPQNININKHLKMFEGSVFDREYKYVLNNLRETPTHGKKRTTDHPPIYPTSICTPEEIGDITTWKLYEFIVRRFFATLSIDAESKTMKINLTANKEPYAITGSQFLVRGWREIYPYSNAEEVILPNVSVGDKLQFVKKTCDEKQTLPPARYSQSKLIQKMEEFGLGTKSTRHEIINKLIIRKYVEGIAMKPTLIGRVVTESLETYANTITKPTMTKTLEQSMEEIAEGTKKKEDVLTESKTMLSTIFDELEANSDAIGLDIINRAREEQTVGTCPVCGKSAIIRQTGSFQFIGCSGYPDCDFNVNLPPSMWGRAVKMGDICPDHNLNHIQLLRKGAPAWKIGCPLCSHIKSNIEAFKMMDGMTDELISKLNSIHIYS